VFNEKRFRLTYVCTQRMCMAHQILCIFLKVDKSQNVRIETYKKLLTMQGMANGRQGKKSYVFQILWGNKHRKSIAHG